MMKHRYGFGLGLSALATLFTGFPVMRGPRGPIWFSNSESSVTPELESKLRHNRQRADAEALRKAEAKRARKALRA